MIEIKKDKIIADGIERDIDNINVISYSRNYLSFSSRIADCAKYEKGIDSFYEEIKKAGLKDFVLYESEIINMGNVLSIDMEFYQYAGISILKTSKENAELYDVVLKCRNGKKETIPFRTYKEAEECLSVIQQALQQMKSEEQEKAL